MDDWLKQLQETLDSAAQDSSRWLGDFAKEADQRFDQIVDQWSEASQETFQDLQEALDPALTEMNAQIDSTLDASIAFVDQQLTPWIEETTAPISCTVNPWLQNHPTCIGCKNYHGMTYGDSMLVCGMHPYGPEDSTCADWQSVWVSRTNG